MLTELLAGFVHVLPALMPALAEGAGDGAAAGAAEAVSPLLSISSLAALGTLTLLEIVLGIDNVVFIAILTSKLPEEKQARVRTIGLLLAAGLRIVLLSVAFLIVRLDKHALFTVLGNEITGKDLLLLAGGLFLIAKAVWEIHELVEGGHEASVKGPEPGTSPGAGTGVTARGDATKAATATVQSVLMQVLVLDLVFSIDSVITAVGLTSHLLIMYTAVIAAVAVMIAFAGPIARFVHRRPTMKTLALSFLVLIGVLLVAEGLGQHFEKGYVYFAMAFSLIVELINIQVRKKRAASNGSGAAHG